MMSGQAGTQATTIYCPQCGQTMRIAPEHMQVAVACPHCNHTLEPWRLVAPTPPVAQPAPGTPPPSPGYAQSPQHYGEYSRRNRWVAGALAILLGPFGVHRFYMGFIGIGILQLALTVGSLFILTWVVAIWAFIEGILCFCGVMNDVDGKPLSG